MDRSTGLAQLTARLQDASTRRDWDLLERAVRELGPQVQALAARGPWSADERVALAQLRTAHDGAVRESSEAAAGLAARLADMRDNKEGWMAYALAGEPEPGDTPR
jgi:hypothetical protein